MKPRSTFNKYTLLCMLGVGFLSFSAVRSHAQSVSVSYGNPCVGDEMVFTLTSGGCSNYSWTIQNATAGTHYSVVGANNQQGFRVKWLAPVSGVYASCNYSCSSGSGNAYSSSQTIVNKVTPSVTISANKNNICAGELVTFTASSANGGSSPNYSWRVNGSQVTSGSSTTFSSSTLANGDLVSAVMTSSVTCVTTTTAISSNITMTVNQPAAVSLSISASKTSVCAGEGISFQVSSSANVGIGSTYKWFVNGVERTSDVNNGPTHLIINSWNYANNSTVYCQVTSSSYCVAPKPKNSNTITVPVTSPELFQVAITLNPSSPTMEYCSGTSITFTAASVNSRHIISDYFWYKNGNSIGSNQSTFTSSTLVHGDVISVDAYSTTSCISNNWASKSLSGSPLTIYPTSVAGSITGTSSVCNSGTASLALGNHTGSVQKWQVRSKIGTAAYSSWSDISNTTTNLSYSVASSGSSAVTYEFRAFVKSGVCAVVNTAAKSVVAYPPTVAGTVGGFATPLCGPQNITPTVSGNVGSVTLWQVRFTDASGTWGTWASFTSTNYAVSPASSSVARNYEFKATVKSGSCSALVTPVKSLTVRPLPAVPTNITAGSTCGPGTVNLSATPPSGSGIKWYTAITNGSLAHTGSTFSPSITATTNYYVCSYNTTTLCESARTLVVATLNTVPAAPSVTGNQRWGTGTLTLTASGAPAGSTYNWYTGADAFLETINPHVTPSLRSNQTNYRRVRAVSSAGCPSSATSVNVVVEQLPTITASDTYIAQNSEVTLSGAGGYTSYAWKKVGNATVLSSLQSYSTNQVGSYTLTVTKSGMPGSGTSTIVIGDQFSGMNLNYIVTNSIQVDGITAESSVSGLNSAANSQTVQYFDGLGRPVQTVATQASPSGKDIVVPNVYDVYGREHRKYLPYVPSESNGRYKTVGYSSTTGDYTHNFYDGTTAVASDNRPFSETQYEASPLNRPLKDFGPGASWFSGGKGVDYGYLTNVHGTGTGQERIFAWTVSANLPVRLLTLETGGYYSSNQLVVKSVKDENGQETREYTDKLGRVVLKKVAAVSLPLVQTPGHWAHTYYIYDDLGNLRFVLQPNLSNTLHATPANPTQTQLNELAFQYSYDERRRMISKRVPGTNDVTYMVYDKRDRLVMTQDAVQRVSNQWLYTKYDHLNRPIITGIYTHGSNISQAAMTSQFSTTSFAESYNGTSSTHGYTNLLFPTTGTVLTVTYYDNYAFKSMIGGTSYNYVSAEISGLPTTEFLWVSGQATGSKTNILSTSTYLWGATYYDDKYRPIQTIAQNNLSGRDRVSSKYDFAGKVLETKTTHIKSTTTTTIARRFDYDHAGRLLRTYHKINGWPELILAENEYNELGQLTEKNLKVPNTGAGSAPFHHKGRMYAHTISTSEYNGEKEIVASQSITLLPGVTIKPSGSTIVKLRISDNDVQTAASQAAEGMQSVDYRYNIRGWLERINNSTLTKDETADPNDFFGMNLSYNVPGTVGGTAQWNGNISNMSWSTNLGLGNTTLSELKEQGYQFTYDAMNRLTAATHRKKVTGWGASNALHERGITYDLNGNIKKLNRKDGLNTMLDSLTYTYSNANTGNKLLKVADIGNDNEGFMDGSDVTNEYAYDANGNLTQDLNKGIGAGKIEYNHLNLPKKVTKSATEYIEYTYTATGQKLRQTLTSAAGNKTTDYNGEFVYENDALKFIQHEEGRVMAAGLGTGLVEYQFNLKDHLGNSRISFTTKRSMDSYMATYEDARYATELALFSPSYDTITRLTAYNHTPGGAKSERLSGSQYEIIGTTKNFKVVPGDTIAVEVFARYNTPTGTSSSVAGFIFQAMTGAFGVSSSSTGDGALLHDALSGMNTAGTLLNSGTGVDDTKPKAYLNYIMFDDNYIPYDFGFDQVSSAASGAWERLVLEARPRKPGFVYIYLSNENSTLVDVFFDDLKIDYTHSPVVQGDDYYPFGATFNSYVSGVKNDFLYQSKEYQEDLGLNLYDFHARQYDPWVVRTTTLDPMSEKYYPLSPYSWVANNPLMFVDPTGMTLDYSQLSKEERKEYKQAFKELKRSGETGKETVKFLKSKESGRIQLTANSSEHFGQFDANLNLDGMGIGGLHGFKQDEIGGVLNLNLKSLNQVGINPTDVLAEEASHAAMNSYEAVVNGGNTDIGYAKGNDEFFSKSIVGQIEKESGRSFTDFGNDGTAREFGRNAFTSKSTKGFERAMEKWQGEQSPGTRYSNLKTNNAVPAWFNKLVNKK